MGDKVSIVRLGNLVWIPTVNVVHAVSSSPVKAQDYELWRQRLIRPDKVTKHLPKMVEGVEFKAGTVRKVQIDAEMRARNKRRGLPCLSGQRGQENGHQAA